MSLGQGGIILHNAKICVAKPLLKNSHLYKMFNIGINSKKKKIYLVKEHTENKDEGLESITFFAITSSEYKKKLNDYKQNKNY